MKSRSRTAPAATTSAKFRSALRGAAVLGLAAAGAGILYPTARHVDNGVHGGWSLAGLAVAPAQAQTPAAAPHPLQALATGDMAAFTVTQPPAPVTGIEIVDSAGKPRPLTDWKGRVVLLNLWATWCAPCLKEMPALDRLKAALAGPDFDVVALNIDKTPEKPQKFVADNKISVLEFLRDPTAKAFAVVKSQGMPTTLLIDRQGREIGRLVGPAEWDGEAAKSLIKAAIAWK